MKRPQTAFCFDGGSELDHVWSTFPDSVRAEVTAAYARLIARAAKKRPTESLTGDNVEERDAERVES